MYAKRITTSFILLSVLLTTSACATLPHHQETMPLAFAFATSTSLASTPVQIISVQADYIITAYSFQELARQSPLIVIGQVTEIGDVINAGLDGNDESKPATDYYDIGQIYRFQVEQFLKGQGDLSDNATINILVFESIIDAPAASITQADIDQRRALQEGCHPRCQPMYPGTRYLLFLRLTRAFPPETQYYAGLHPWMFPLTNPDYITAEDPWSDVYQYFPPQPLADILWQVENPDVPYVRPTPTRDLSTPIPVPYPYPIYPYPNPNP